MALPRHRVRGPFDADRIGEVQRRFGSTTERDHRRAARVGLQGSDQRRADAAGSADDQRAKSREMTATAWRSPAVQGAGHSRQRSICSASRSAMGEAGAKAVKGSSSDLQGCD